MPGDTVGIIGKNGAGKSTLLKILSKITPPTSGKIISRGRIASLLEVGTGFHPELTGRENIYLNGTILGMRRKEIQKNFDAIVDFSGVEKFLDTPLKHYSSGMQLRLAFAVAAFLENEILIIDEVLAVGDAEFQKKCMGKMEDVSKGGRTVLFVSHNMASLKQLCSRGVLLSKGNLHYQGNLNSTIDQYVSITTKELSDKFTQSNSGGSPIELLSAEIFNAKKVNTAKFSIDDDIFIKIKVSKNSELGGVYGYVLVKNQQEMFYIESDTFDHLPNIFDEMPLGVNEYLLKINRNVLPFGKYIVDIDFASPFNNYSNFGSPGEILKFEVSDEMTKRGAKRLALTSQLLKWEKYVE